MISLSSDKPSYYTIMPAHIRYHEKLSGDEKVLFCDLAVLSEKGGWCHASNAYFARVYGVSEKTISRWIKGLKNANMIEVMVKKSKGNKRYIRPVKNTHKTENSDPKDYGQKCLYPMDECVYTYGQDCPYPMDKCVLHSITRFNNNSFYSESDVERIIKFLNIKSPNVNYEFDDEIAIQELEKRASEGTGVEDILLIIEHKAAMWSGTEMEQYLQPSTLFGDRHIKKYIAESRHWEKSGKPARKTKSTKPKTNEGAKPRGSSKNSFSNFSQRDTGKVTSLTFASRKKERMERENNDVKASVN